MSKDRKEIPLSEIPLPSDRLILMDLDKTLIDTSYNLTDTSVLKEIARVQSLGWRLGFSSDTPLEPLKSWAEKFGMNGPIIAEKGSVLYIPEVGEFVLSKTEEFFDATKKSLIGELTRLRIPFVHGDATQFIRNNPKLVDMADQRIVAINAYRRCSLSFFARKVDNEGSIRINNQFGQEMADLARGYWAGSDLDLVEDFNPEYGIYILSPVEVNKRLGTIKLMKMLSLSKIGMIGDSQADIIGSDLAVQYAVRNAKDELKKVADYIAESDYASGVSEILSSIKS